MKKTQTPAKVAAPANVAGETPTANTNGSEPKPEIKIPEKPAPKTLDELKADYATSKAAYKQMIVQGVAVTAEDGTVTYREPTEDEETDAQAHSYKLNLLVKQKERQIELDEKQKTIDAAKAVRAGLVDELIAAAIKAHVDNENTKLTLDEKNISNNVLRDKAQYIREELGKTAGRVIIAPQGMSGKTLEKTLAAVAGNGGNGLGAQVMQHLRDGKTKDELLALGFTDGTIRSQQWKLNRERKS